MTISSTQGPPSSSAEEPQNRLLIDIWADVLCPWCYIGEERLAKAIADSPHAEAIDLSVHTFELDPQAPTDVISILDYVATKYGLTAAQAREMEENAARQAHAEGLEFTVDRPTHRTFDMLRLIHLANEYGAHEDGAGAHGAGWQLLRALQDRVFTGHQDAFEHATLIRLGEQVGVPAAESRAVLTSDRYADAVRADHAQAQRLGATGVPFMVLGGHLGIPGATTVEGYAAAIERAWEQVNG